MSRNRNNQQNRKQPLSIFDNVRDWAPGPFVIWVFLVAIGITGGGVILFVEDTYTSYMGVMELERAYNVEAAKWQSTYLALSLLPQLLQIALGYIYLAGAKRDKWIIPLFLLMFAMDFGADVYHRSKGDIGFDAHTAVSAMLSFVAFTAGAEVVLTLGVGIALATLNPAIVNFRRVKRGLSNAIGQRLDDSQSNTQNNQRPNQQRPNQQRPPRPPVARPTRESQPQNGRDPQYSEASMEYFFHLDDK